MATTVPTPATPQSRTKACHDSLARFFARVKNIFVSVIPQYLYEHIQGALTFVEAVKSIVDNPTVEGIIDGLTKNLTEPIFSAIRANIDYVIDVLQIEIACKGGTLDDKIVCMADYIGKQHPEIQAALIHRMAVILARITSGDETTTESELNALVAFAENERSHNANAPVEA